MKKIEKILLQGCTFTVLISLLFFIFAQISAGDSEISIGFVRYIIIMLFGFIIALTNTVFEFKRLHIAFKYVIHYGVLLAAFLVIFSDGALSLNSAAGFFVAVFIFTILYAIITLITFLIKKSINGIDSKIEKNNTVKKTTTEKNSKKSYEPRFK